jgi:hypothetical protein
MSVRVAELRADGSAVLAVVEDQPATALYDAGGTQVGHSPAIGKATMLLDVGRTSGGYRINGVHQG